MPSVPLHLNSLTHASASPSLSLPNLLQTPSGLAILEIQGTIHAPFPSPSTTDSDTTVQTPIGRLEFPLYDASEPEDKAWMKKVWFYVGKNQRLVGEVKALGKPLGVLRKRSDSDEDGLEIAEVIRWKIVFRGRPEPV